MLNTNAKKWVEALRSGKYKQGFRRLSSTTGAHCCLGVACALYQEEHKDCPLPIKTYEEYEYGEGEYGEGYISYAGETLSLPPKVQEWLGVREKEATYYNNQARDKLIALTWLNDTGKPFAEIADIIESEPEGLFCPN